MTPFPVFGATVLPWSGRKWTTVVAEFSLPTGSFKDRGAAAVVEGARAAGARRVTLDSSGNAGLAVAAAAGRIGLSSLVRVSDSISPAKAALLRAAGAEVEKHPSRDAAAAACVRDAGSYDASHVRNPLFRSGVATLARAWLERGPLPESVFLPVGNGSLLLGLCEGLAELRAEGLIEAFPALVGAQAERCAPLVRPEAPGDGHTIADGCAILAPAAAGEILAAIRASGGEVVAVPEDEIESSWIDAWRRGIPIEPTSALAFAALARAGGSGSAAVIATGSGLKAPPPASPSG